MAKLEFTVEINDGSLLEAVAEVRQKQRDLNEAVRKLESIVSGVRSCIVPEAAVTKEIPFKRKPPSAETGSGKGEEINGITVDLTN